MTCLIMGCELVLDYGRKWCHGDLHEVGGAYVFNACLEDGETAWRYERFPGDERMILRIDGDYFERRGVIVVGMSEATLNERATKYVATPVAWIDSVLGS